MVYGCGRGKNTDAPQLKRISYVPKDRRKSELSMRMVNYKLQYIQKSSGNASSSILERDRPQHDRSVACVIAEKYSSATLVSLCFHSRNEKDDMFQKFCRFRFFCYKIAEVVECVFRCGRSCRLNHVQTSRKCCSSPIILREFFFYLLCMRFRKGEDKKRMS